MRAEEHAAVVLATLAGMVAFGLTCILFIRSAMCGSEVRPTMQCAGFVILSVGMILLGGLGGAALAYCLCWAAGKCRRARSVLPARTISPLQVTASAAVGAGPLFPNFQPLAPVVLSK